MNNRITSELHQIPIPKQLHNYTEAGIHRAENEQKGTLTMFKFKKITIAAALALVILAGTVTHADSIRGSFVDVKNPVGAVTGTEYTNATAEIEITAESNSAAVTVNARFLYPAAAPYAFITELSLKNVTVTDSSGNTLLTVSETEKANISNGTVSIVIPTGTVTLSPNDEYTINFDTIVGHAKAEQPLPMSGNWFCTVK